MSNDSDTAKQIAEAAKAWPGLVAWVLGGMSAALGWLAQHTINSHREALREIKEEIRAGFNESREDRKEIHRKLDAHGERLARVETIHDNHDQWERRLYGDGAGRANHRDP